MVEKKHARNPNSSAKWPFQWIDWYKWKTKSKKFNRQEGNFSPFETWLRRTDSFYNNWVFTNFKSENTPEYIKTAWNNNWKLDLKNFNSDKQLDLWFIDLLMRWKKWREYMMWIMVWNYYYAKKSYENIHHTRPNRILKKQINNNIDYIDFITLSSI